MKRGFLFPSLLVLLFLLIMGTLIWAVPLRASTTIIVNTTSDELLPDGDCSLREAIRAANLDTGVDACPAGNGGDTILLPAGVYTLSLVGAEEDDAATGDLDITADLAIIGAGSGVTVIDRITTPDRILHIPMTTTLVTISGVTIRNGNPGMGIFGGGISNAGVLTLTNSIVSGNTGSGGGGGIANRGTLTILHSSILSNTASSGGGGISNHGTLTLFNSSVFSNTGSTGGIFNDPVGVLTLANSTISGNLGNGVANGGIMTLNNVTLTNNTSNSGGGGIADFGGVTNLKNSILAGNHGPGSSPDCSGTLTSQGYNLIQSITGCTVSTTDDIIGLDPNLIPLRDNGGASLTHALLPGSPAIDAGNPAMPGSGGHACEATDQRGVTRPQNERCDIGAYEANAPVFLPLILKTS